MKQVLTFFISAFLLVGILSPAATYAESIGFGNGLVDVSAQRPCTPIDVNLRLGNRNSSVKTLQVVLKLNGYLNVEPTGYFGPLTLKAVKDFQKATNLPITGYFGPLSREQMKKISCDGTNPTNTDLKISVTTDKPTYSANETILITLTATNQTNRDITLNWNSGCQVDYTIGAYRNLLGKMCTQALTSVTISPLNSKSWTITHELSVHEIAKGIYDLQSTILNYGSATTSITISENKVSKVTVISPNGGENFRKGTIQKITWTSFFPYPTFAAIGHTIRLVAPLPECAIPKNNGPICLIAVQAPIVLAENVTGGSFDWNVGTDINGQSNNIYNGQYKIEVCMSGLQTCDQSDSTITISQ